MSNKDETIRAFIGLELSKSFYDVLERTQRGMKKRTPYHSMRWVRPSNMHLTLFFLGDGVTPHQTELLSKLMDELASDTYPFLLTTGKLGAFPTTRDPRIIWAGVSGQVKPLKTLKSEIDEAVTPLGWTPEKRRYQPHLTLGYVKDAPAIFESRLSFGRKLPEAGWNVTKMHLYRSEQSRNGPRYTKIHTSQFADIPS